VVTDHGDTDIISGNWLLFDRSHVTISFDTTKFVNYKAYFGHLLRIREKSHLIQALQNQEYFTFEVIATQRKSMFQ
jgi:hypothetical protein